MKLQILVPQYREDDSIVAPLLKSLAAQKFIDFNDISIIICNDGSDVLLSDAILTGWPFKVEYHKEPHRGISGTRNACLDYATAEYVMWCDADDKFFMAHGLWMIFNELSAGDFDIFSSAFEEESQSGHRLVHVYDDIFVHGKVYRHQFLIDNNIRWADALTVQEDRYFTRLAMAIGRVHYHSTPFYRWCWRDNSITRYAAGFMSRTFLDLIKGNGMLLRELASRDLTSYAPRNAIDVVEAYDDIYKDSYTDERQSENFACLKNYCKEFKEFVLPSDRNEIVAVFKKLYPKWNDKAVSDKTDRYISKVSSIIQNT